MPEVNKSKGNPGPYISAVNGASHLGHPGTLISPSPALVLDDICVTDRDFSKYAMGRVKDFNSIPNLQIILADEGFEEVKLFYLGGKWVLLEFDNVETKDNLMNHIGVNSWFNVIQDVIHDFVREERVVWVDIKGIPLHAQSRENFARIGKKQRELLNIEDTSDLSFGQEEGEINTSDIDDVAETIFGNSFDSPKKHNDAMGNSVGIGKEKYGGSVLGVLEEVIRVGKAMGYSMEGCGIDVELIIGNQGDDVVFR
nr:RNA-directed DNA polymerase, eukaryota [Tanacetum cinerariifolium]